MLDIRLNDRCPECGNKLDKITIDFSDGKSIGIDCRCRCGFASEIRSKTISTYGGSTILCDEPAIDRWNKLAGIINDKGEK